MTVPSLVVDTSALAAIVFGEPDAETYAGVLLRHAGSCALGGPTLVEAEIVVESRLGPSGSHLLAEILERTSATVMPFDAGLARGAIGAWRRFGKGRHPARLNLGDCFSYALSKHHNAPLLFKGHDFAQTDVLSAL